MLAVVFGVQSRRQIRGTGGTLGGNGLAIAGIVIGVIGLLVTIDLSVAGVIQVRVGEPASTPRTGALGQVLRIPAGYSDNGISRVTVYSVTFPVASQDPIISAPDLGKEFAVADVQMCAGRDGSQDGPNAFNFFLIFADGTDVSAAVGAIRNPSVSDVNTLGPGQCSRGWVPFQIAAGTQPAAVQYGLINGFRWTLPASG